MSRRRSSGTSTLYKLSAVALGFIFLLVLVDVAGIYDVSFLQFGERPSAGPAPGPGRETPCDYPTAIVTTDVAAWDSLDITTSRTIGTDINVLWFRYSGGWIQLAAGDGQDITVQQSDNNIIYMAVQFPSSPSYYVDYEKILQMNPHVSWYGYQDITGDNVEEFIFKVDISGSTYASATGKWNMPAVNIYLLTYDNSFAIPTGGKPADITGIGTSTVTKYLKWYAEISAEKKAIAVYKVVLTVNTSDISKVTLKKMNIPGIGYLDGSSFTQDVLSGSIKWTYTISQNVLYGADYIKRPVNDPNEFKFTTALELNLASGDVLQVTLTIYQLTPAEASISDSDSVILSA